MGGAWKHSFIVRLPTKPVRRLRHAASFGSPICRWRATRYIAGSRSISFELAFSCLRNLGARTGKVGQVPISRHADLMMYRLRQIVRDFPGSRTHTGAVPGQKSNSSPLQYSGGPAKAFVPRSWFPAGFPVCRQTTAMKGLSMAARSIGSTIRAGNQNPHLMRVSPNYCSAS